MDLIIEELQKILTNKDFDKYYLEKYKDVYEISSINYKKKCAICDELEKQDLPYDCLFKPSYCVKNKNDFDIICLYDELKENIDLKNYG